MAYFYFIYLLVQNMVLKFSLLDDEVGNSLILSGIVALATNDVTF